MIMVVHSIAILGLTADSWRFVLPQGVTLFFILSGFIMVYVYPHLSRADVPRYWFARFARLWPAHIVVFAFSVFLLVSGVMPVYYPPINGALALQPFLLQAWLPTHANMFNLNIPSWTLSVEAFFYLLFPPLLLGLRRFWWLQLALAFLAAALIAFAGNDWLVAHLPGTDYGTSIEWPPARVFEFVLGMCTALCFAALSQRTRPGRGWATTIEVAAILLAFAAMAYTHELVQLAASLHPMGKGGELWSRLVGTVCIPYAILILVLALRWGPITKALSWLPLVVLGESSYSLYLVHFPLIVAVRAFVTNAKLTGSPLMWSYAVYFPLTIGTALALWYFVERPCRRLLLRRWTAV